MRALRLACVPALAFVAAAVASDMLLPDGSVFVLWNDQTGYTTSWHVDNTHPSADDNGSGSATQPFRTIQKAAYMVQPGQEVVIHGGTYREYVRLRRQGTGPSAMIRFRAEIGDI